MPLTFEEKKVVVEQVSSIAKKSLSAVVAKYIGLSVADMTSLRVKARNSKMFIKVVPNTLAKRALKDTDFACLEDHLVGPVLLIFSEVELGAPAKLVKDYSKINDKLQPVALAVGNQFYSAKDLDRVASLPSRDEALAKLLSVMKAPISKFVRTLAEPHAKLVRTLVAIKDSKSS
jgi:large subunit ribosomal protein L10